ncbi:CBU_0592 family membrane protein [Curtobacterium sp. Leaf261]|uniref:CBU_0592 family membrane protein n=1 Tax=Curtobacterium sp. Leaf261 TaxID=1736311 RepID=UPI0006FBF3E6|nr:hypothetical protein [Curtobacterium sp. Leaf261]KQO63640.1 hypothetical protein ASF23_05265 [Curtobacterium sp. Leaf261]
MGVIIESLGWFGAVTILGGYLLFSAGRLRNGVAYQVINLVGALAITVNVLAHHAWPSTIVNSIWAVIAAVVLVRMAVARKRAATSALAVDGTVLTEAHSELPTTTMVLPVIGPAVRDPETMAEIWAVDETTARVTDGPAVSAEHPAAATDAAGPQPSLQTGSLTMADVPVVTAAIAVAIIAAARDEVARDEAARDEVARDEVARDEVARDEAARDEPVVDRPSRSVDVLERSQH